MAQQDLVINVLAQVADAVRDLRKVEEQTKRVAESTRMWTAISARIQAVTAAYNVVSGAISMVLERVKELYNGWDTARRAIIQLQAAIQSSNLAFGESYRILFDYANALQAVTNYGTDAIMPVEAFFVRTGMGIPEVQRATKATLDLAAATGMDLSEAMRKVARFIEDPNAAIGRLLSSGVAFTEQQKELIAQLEGTADAGQKTQLALQILEQSYGGMAENMVDPTKQAQNAWGALQSELGKGFWAAAQAGAQMLMEAINALTGSMGDGKAIAQAVVDVLTAVMAIGEGVVKVIQGILAVIEYVISVIARAISYIPFLSKSTKDSIRSFADETKRYADSNLKSFTGIFDLSSYKAMEFNLKASDLINSMDQVGQAGKKAGDLFAEGMDDAAKASQKVQEQLEKIREDVETFGMSDIDKKLYELRKMGASEEELRQAKEMLETIERIKKEREATEEKQREAKKIIDEIKSDEEKLIEDVRKARELYEGGFLTEEQYRTYLEKKKGALVPKEETFQKFYAEAIAAGPGSFSQILSSIESFRRMEQQPQKETARNTQRMVQQLDELLAAVKGGEQEVLM